MKLVRPYIDENWQVIFVECEDTDRQDVVNGMIFGICCIDVLFALWYWGLI